ncbi:MAG: class IV adenylate cyclase [Patescibacteria group bacterium]
MIIENEVKYRVKDLKKIKEKIKESNFLFSESYAQCDYYFSPPHKSFAGTRKYYLRLRKQGNEGIFAYHVVKNNLQTIELESRINDFKNFFKILKLLNFKLDCIVEKKREVYKNGKITLMLDEVKRLGSFIEIEYCGTMTKGIKTEFKKMISFLNLMEKDIISGVGYPDLLMNK